MRILFIGDIVGRSGRAIVVERLPALVRDWKLDFVVINGENAAGAFGITETIYNDLVNAGADAVTLGNHCWDQKEASFSSSARPPHPPGELSEGHAGPRRRAGRGAQRRSRPRRQCDGPGVHGAARRSVRRHGTRSRRVSAQDRRRSHHRRRAREASSEKQAIEFPRRQGEPRDRHPHPCADSRSSGAAQRHRVHDRCRHDRRLQFLHRHGQGRAADPVPAPHPQAATPSPRSGRRRCAASRSRPTMRPASRAASRAGAPRSEARRSATAVLGQCRAGRRHARPRACRGRGR